MTQLSSQERPPSARAAKAERRNLTVVFCDMVGSTELSSRLDPEDLRDIMRAFQRSCESAIFGFDGRIGRYMGDGILAYFGFPAAHEDSAERAVQPALEGIRLVSELSFEGVPRLEMRVGIATGLVVVGDLIGEGPSREFALVGDAPNLAARLQQLAKPNQILVAPATRRLLGDLFEFEDLGVSRGLDSGDPGLEGGFAGLGVGGVLGLGGGKLGGEQSGAVGSEHASGEERADDSAWCCASCEPGRPGPYCSQ